MNTYEFLIKMKDYASGGLREIADSAGVARNRIDTVGTGIDTIDKKSGRLGTTLGKLKTLMITAFATMGIATLVSQTIGARQEYEKFEAVLTNTFQSAEVGQGALNMLTDFASKTPFQVNELTSSFIQLVNRGFNPAQDEMTKMGDLASSQGKSFGQLTEAILDAETNEFERLKEFGIKTKKVGSQVQMTFKGVTQTVDANGKSIRKAILEYGGMKGVANSMSAISKTLGGRLSNLKDQFWSLLVTIGGESSGIFNGFINGLTGAMAFLSGHVAHISVWFRELWGILTPIGLAFYNVTSGVLGANAVMSAFGIISLGILTVLGVFVEGVMNPFGQGILFIAGAWWAWTQRIVIFNGVLAIYNALMAVNPITWVVIGVIALIGVIGLLSKYTSGWGESWRAVVNGSKLLWKGFVFNVKSGFENVVDKIMIGINKIKIGWYSFKNAVGLGDASANNKILQQINADTNRRKKEIKDNIRKSALYGKQASDEFSKVGISVDGEGLGKDFNALKNKFSNIGQKPKSSLAYTSNLDKLNKKSLGGANGGKGAKGKKDMIVSGGSKQTNVTVHIGKLQDKTEIHVSSSEKGINNLGDKIREELLRAVNSVNQMQTA